jgi:hypothetical protein
MNTLCGNAINTYDVALVGLEVAISLLDKETDVLLHCIEIVIKYRVLWKLRVSGNDKGLTGVQRLTLV